jgi:hypothetical protein
LPTKSLQFEGPVLEDVLVQAMTEAGPQGRVSSADRIRRGGIAGFFAREHFEVVVEIDDDTGDEPAAPAVTKAERLRVMASAEPAATWVPATPSPAWGALADDTEDVLELTGSPSQVTTAGNGSTASTSTSAGTGTGADGTDALTRNESNAGGAASANLALASLSPSAGVPSTERASFANVLAGIAQETVFGDDAIANQESAHIPVSDTDYLIEHDPPVAVGPAARAIARVDATSGSLPAMHGPLPVATEVAEPATADVAATPEIATMATPADSTFVAPSLMALGLPETLLPDTAVMGCLETLSMLEDGQAYVHLALVTALSNLPEPPPPPDAAGSLLVVAGEFSRSLAFANKVASQVGIDPEQVVIAPEARRRAGVGNRVVVRTPEEALQITARSRRQPTVTIVALHAPVSADANPWVCRMLDALEPTAVWGVAGATSKCEDVSAWADGLGGLDALAMEDVTSTMSPAQVLATGIPVASLDGRRATPALWAAVIAGRLLLERVGTLKSAVSEGS